MARFSDVQTMSGSAVDRNNLLYLSSNAKPEIWVICGEHDPTSREEIYMYFILTLCYLFPR